MTKVDSPIGDPGVPKPTFAKPNQNLALNDFQMFQNSSKTKFYKNKENGMDKGMKQISAGEPGGYSVAEAKAA